MSAIEAYVCPCLHALTSLYCVLDNKILDLTKLKAFADIKVNPVQMIIYLWTSENRLLKTHADIVGNIVG